MATKSIEPVRPQCTVGLEPVVEFRKRRRIKVVEAPLSIAPDADEPMLAEHPEVLRDPRLAEAGDVNQLADRPRARAKGVEDLPPSRLRDSHKRICHGSYITRSATLREVLRARSDLSTTTGRPPSRKDAPSARGRCVPASGAGGDLRWLVGLQHFLAGLAGADADRLVDR